MKNGLRKLGNFSNQQADQQAQKRANEQDRAMTDPTGGDNRKRHAIKRHRQKDQRQPSFRRSERGPAPFTPERLVSWIARGVMQRGCLSRIIKTVVLVLYSCFWRTIRIYYIRSHQALPDRIMTANFYVLLFSQLHTILIYAVYNVDSTKGAFSGNFGTKDLYPPIK